MSEETLTLDLNGNFDLRAAETGEAISISAGMRRALFVLLVTGKDNRRSRDWIKARLWPDRGGQQAQDSLRTACSELKKDLGSYGDILCADRSYISLRGVTLVSYTGATGAEFFEDAPKLPQPDEFDDWLRMERAYRAAKSEKTLTTEKRFEATAQTEQTVTVLECRPIVVISTPLVFPLDEEMEGVANSISAQIINSFATYGLVDVADLRNLDKNQMAMFGGGPIATPHAELQVSIGRMGSQIACSIVAAHPRTRCVIWSMTHIEDEPGDPAFPKDQIAEFSNHAVDALHNRILSGEIEGYVDESSRRGSLFAPIHHVLSMTVDGLEDARDRFRVEIENTDCPIAHAWLAFSASNSVGERDRVLDPSFYESAEYHCSRALELAPSNGLVNALAAHVYGFVLGRQEAGAELAANARRLTPQLAIGWDLSAMNALYNNRLQDGYKFSLIAGKLGRFSPYKPFFDSSLAISATITGRHDVAISTAQALLSRRPGFLAVMRHLAASLAATDRVDETRICISQIQQRDPAFTALGIHDARYPLPCQGSVELIDSAFKTAGLK